MKDFDNSVESKIGNYRKALVQREKISDDILYINFISKDDIDINELIEVQERMNDDAIFSIPNSDNNQYYDILGKELQDKYVGTRILLPRGGSYNEADVKKRKRTANGNYLIDRGDTNPSLDTRIYEVEFADGGLREYSTNMIAGFLYSSCDEEGNRYSLLQGIVNHRTTEEAVNLADGFCEVNGVCRQKIMMAGWEL